MPAVLFAGWPGLIHIYFMGFKKIAALVVVAVLCLFFGAFAQGKVAVDVTAGGLKVGDSVPEDFWEQEHTVYKGGRVFRENLSTYRGRLLLVDFWASWCGPCVAMLPKVAGLSERFSDGFSVLLVNAEDAGVAGATLQRAGIGMGSVVGDRSIARMFPHRLVPHYAWIGRDGRVIGTSGADEVTAERISSYLSGGSKAMKMKVDRDRSQLLFAAGEEIDRVRYRSVLGKGRLSGTGSSFELGEWKGGRRVLLTNTSLEGMYEICFRGLDPSYDASRLELSVSDRNGFGYRGDPAGRTAWTDSNAYSLDLSMGEASDRELYGHMLGELNRATGLNGRLEARMERCLLLRVRDRELLEKSSAARFGIMGRLVSRLNGLGLPKHVVDRTGAGYGIDLSPDGNWDRKKLDAALADFGLELVSGTALVNYFLVGDAGKELRNAK